MNASSYLLGSFFIIRAIIGVFIDEFGYISGAKLLTERQKLWRDMHRMAASMSPVPLATAPPGRSLFAEIRRRCHRVVSHPNFNRVALASVCANTALLALYRYNDGETWDAAQRLGDAAFVFVYVCEATAKALAAHPHVHYWRDRWNIFELVLAIGSAATVFTTQGSWREQLGRPFRFSRVFRVVRFFPSLGMLCDQMILAVPSMLSIIGLMMIWVFVYAGIGTQVFPNVKYGKSLNKDANFETFPNSFLLLFQCLTGEGWRGFMHDAMITEPECVRENDFDNCGYPIGAVLYFVTYIIAMGYIFTNLFVAAILDHVTFGTTTGVYKDTRGALIIGPTHLWEYQSLWTRYDPRAEGYVGAHKIRSFLDELSAGVDSPLGGPIKDGVGGGGSNNNKSSRYASWLRPVMHEITTLHIPGRGVPFRELLETLIAVRLGPQALTVDVRLKREQELREVRRWGAAVTVQAWVRGGRVRRGLRVAWRDDVVA